MKTIRRWTAGVLLCVVSLATVYGSQSNAQDPLPNQTQQPDARKSPSVEPKSSFAELKAEFGKRLGDFLAPYIMGVVEADCGCALLMKDKVSNRFLEDVQTRLVKKSPDGPANWFSQLAKNETGVNITGFRPLSIQIVFKLGAANPNHSIVVDTFEWQRHPADYDEVETFVQTTFHKTRADTRARKESGEVEKVDVHFSEMTVVAKAHQELDKTLNEHATLVVSVTLVKTQSLYGAQPPELLTVSEHFVWRDKSWMRAK